MKSSPLKWIGLAAAAAMSCAQGAGGAGEPLCQPGDNVFCRCVGGGAGTKACTSDGMAFTECVCDGSVGGPSDSSSSGAIPPEGPGQGGWGSGGLPDDGSGLDSAGGPSQGGGPPGGGASGAPGGGGEGGAPAPPGGSGPGGSGPTGGGPAGLELLATCSDNAACASGLCQHGLCTQSCSKVSDCPYPAAECVVMSTGNLCLPRCESAAGCAAFGAPASKCGFGYAVDNWRVAVCAKWGAAHQLTPINTDCLPYDHSACHLGYTRSELVCSDQGVCTKGCYLDSNCPAGKKCTGNGSLGNCVAEAP